MPKPSIPSLEAYDNDTYRLIHLTPDEKNLNEYLYPPKVGQARPSSGARARSFSVSNIFSSPPNAPKDQRQYDLAPGRLMPNNLADVAGDGLLLTTFHPAPSVVPHGVNVVLTPMHELGHEGFGQGRDWFALSTVDPQTRQPQYSDVLITKALESIATHNKAVAWLCETLWGQWETALFYYHNASTVDQAWQLDPRTPLYLDPALQVQPLPDRPLLTELYQHGQTHQLLLVTARHELSYLYHKVERWRKLPLLQRPASCLSPWDVGLLTARSRGVPRWINREVLGEVHGDHAFVTELEYQHTSDLAERYHRIGQWARELQLVVLEVGKCPEPGCTKPIRMTLRGGTTRGGRNSLYCDEHTRSRKVTPLNN